MAAALCTRFLERLLPILHTVYKGALLCLGGQCWHPQDIAEGGIDVPKKIREAASSTSTPSPPHTQRRRVLCAQVKPHVLMSLSVPRETQDIEGVIGEAFRRVEKEHIEAYCRHQGRNVTSCVAGIPRLQRCHLDLRRWEVERRARDRGTNPLQSMKHNRVRRGGLLTPGVCKSELPFVQA